MRQLALIDLAPDSRPVPVLKWAGGKRWLAPIIGPEIDSYLSKTGGKYHEPFVGGAAVALWLSHSRMVLTDVEEPLIETYRAIRADSGGVFQELESLIKAGTDRETYLSVRSAEPKNVAARAARFVYLNHLCFNGLYRTNRAGRFNVPYGRRKSISFPDRARLEAAANALSSAELGACDFEKTISNAERGDVIFADPPYHTERAGFVSYHQKPFGQDEQTRLATSVASAAQRGVWVIATNADTPFVRATYHWASLSATRERRAINSDGQRRGAVRCLLIQAPERLLVTR